MIPPAVVPIGIADVIRRRWWQLLLAAVLYTVLITDAGTLLPRPDPPLELTFNSMLEHLLAGRWDVDPATVGPEGFTRDGRTYAYWGILPALLRLPLTLVPGWPMLNVTPLSCVVATLLMLAIKLWMLDQVRAAVPALSPALSAAVATVLILAGAQTTFLKTSLYQEVCLWAGVFGALFAAVVLRGWLVRAFTARALLVLAAAAGAALLTRVSVAVGLYAALGLLGLALVWRTPRPETVRRMLPAIILAAVFLGVAGWVNHGRWGDPLTFADYSLYNFNQAYPDRIARTAEFGLFSEQRIGFGLIYYFAPVWAFQSSEGTLYLDEVRRLYLDAVELPPSSFLLTDALLVGLFACAVRHARRLGPELIAALAGLSLSALLMLTAISMNFRYRIDFYPLLELGAFAGLAIVGVSGRRIGAGGKALVWSLAAVSIVSSLFILALYRLGEFGPAERLMPHGIVRYYGNLI